MRDDCGLLHVGLGGKMGKITSYWLDFSLTPIEEAQLTDILDLSACCIETSGSTHVQW